MNIRDTETIKALLERMSFEETNAYEEADLLLLNTCAIRRKRPSIKGFWDVR